MADQSKKSKAQKKSAGKPGEEHHGPAQDSPKQRILRRWRTAGHVGIQIVLMFIVFGQLNYLSCRRHVTNDLSQNRKFTLSETSEGALKSLGVEVKVVMAFLGTSELYSDVKGLISEYDRLGGDGVTAEYLDLSRSRDRISELRDLYKLQFSRDQIVILGGNERIRVISAEELVTRDDASGRVIEFKGEEVLTSALLEVAEKQQRKIYLITGDRRADELVRIAAQLQPLTNAQNARLESLGLEGVQTVPDDADALFFPGNSEDLTTREVELVQSWWEERNGGLVVFLDPNAKTPNLNGLLREQGVAPNDDRVLSVLSIPGVAARKTSDVPITVMAGSGPTRDLPALTTRLTGQTQSLEVLYEDDLLISENVRPMPLMLAGQGFWGETEYRADQIEFNPDLDNGRPDPVFVAASVEKGKLGDANMEQESSRLVVVGNANLIDPDGGTSKVAADFTMASMNWVMNREELIGISPRQPTAFTLNVSAEEMGLLQMFMIFVLPILALVAGGFVWMKRRA